MRWWRWWSRSASEFTAPTPWVDFHCHIVPGVDDGPRTVEQAVAMVKYAAHLGVTHLVTTVHYSDRYQATPAEIAAQLGRVREALRATDVHVDIIVGREVTLTDQHVRALIESHHVRIGNAPLALVELPEGLNRGTIVEGCSALLNAGIQLVIAHPERNFIVQENADLVADLRLRGVRVQINAGSLAGVYGAAAKRTAWHLLRQQLADVLSSDAHALKDYDRYVHACRIATDELGAATVTELISTAPARFLRLLTRT